MSRRTAARGALAVTIAFAAAGFSSAQVGDAPARVARGQELVRNHCGGCHAVGGRDKSPMHLAPPLRELHRRYEPAMLAEALAEGILTGHPAMPPFRFAPADVDAIIRYLDSVQTRHRG